MTDRVQSIPMSLVEDSILFLDLGNTRLKWRLVMRGGAHINGSAVHAEMQLALKASLGNAQPHKVFIASVASPSVFEACSAVCYELLNLIPRRVEVEQGVLGLSLRYQELGRFGVDRWLALLAAMDAFPKEGVVVVDAGTAVTVDCASPRCQAGQDLCVQGEGSILPGLASSFTPLFGALGIGSNSLALEGWQAGETSLQCLCNGLRLVVEGLCLSIVDRYAGYNESNSASAVSHPRFVFGGGDADLFMACMPDHCKSSKIDQLVLRGLEVWVQAKNFAQ